MRYFVVKCSSDSSFIIRANNVKSREGKVVISRTNKLYEDNFTFRGNGIGGSPQILGHYKTKKEAYFNHFELFL